MPDLFIPLCSINNAKDNDRVVVRMVRWEKGDKRPVGEVVSVLDAENSNDAAMKEILLENGFPLDFRMMHWKWLPGYRIPSALKK